VPGRRGTGLPHPGLRPALHACRAARTAAEVRAVLARVGARELGEIAERMRDQGIAFGYHNHH